MALAALVNFRNVVDLPRLPGPLRLPGPGARGLQEQHHLPGVTRLPPQEAQPVRGQARPARQQPGVQGGQEGREVIGVIQIVDIFTQRIYAENGKCALNHLLKVCPL